jgi:hypothetical protein
MHTKDFYKKLQEIVATGKPPAIVSGGEGAYLTIDGKKKLNFVPVIIWVWPLSQDCKRRSRSDEKIRYRNRI